MTTVAATDARVALLARLIDHAPMFPPASLPPEAALAVDRRARANSASFMLGRLVWPASRWAELGDEPRTVSAVLDEPAPSDPRIESVELRHPGSLAELVRLAGEVFVELPIDALDELPRLRAHGLHAKVRCGGTSAPAAGELAAFVRACRRAGVAFKATAGLHHPVGRGSEHGFLNLLAAVVFGDEENALAEHDPDAFSLTPERFAWRDREAGAAELGRARSERIRSIGSCSFFEPVDELTALGVLPA